MSKRFIEAYLDAAIFTDCGPDSECSDDSQLSEQAYEKATEDCQRFIEQAGDLLPQAGDDSQNGHDFWFTRNGHGVGFWDRGYPEQLGNALSKIAKSFGEQYLMEGDDNLLYLE